MIKSVYRPSRRKNGKRVRSRIYWGQYRLHPDDRIQRMSLTTTDKRVAEKRLAEIVQQAERVRAGIDEPADQGRLQKTPLTEFLRGFLADLTARQRAKQYIKKIESRCGKLILECDWEYWTDITAETFMAWRSAQALAPRTLNHYLDAMHALLEWMVESEVAERNPLG